MGFLDSLPGRSSDSSDPDDEDEEEEERRLVEYEICESGPDDSGGWSPIEGYGSLSFPMDEEEFRYNEEPLQPGAKYKIFGKDQNGRRMKPPEEEDWMFIVKNDATGSSGNQSAGGDTAELKSEVRELRREMRQLAAEGHDQGHDPEQILDTLRANLLASAVSNEAFMSQYGEKMMDWALQVDTSESDNGPDYDDFSESPFAAIAYDMSQTMMHEPHKMRAMGENFGGGLGAFFDGVATGAGEPITSETDGDDAPDRDREIDGGPTSLDELAGATGNESEQVAEEMSELLQEHREATSDETDESSPETDAADVEGQTQLDDTTTLDGMSAGQTQAAEGDPGQDAIAESEVRASPEVAEEITSDEPAPPGETAAGGLDPELCQHVKPGGEQCGNPPEDNSEYCWVEGHGPSDNNTDTPEETPSNDTGEEDDRPAGDGEPSAEEVADAI